MHSRIIAGDASVGLITEVGNDGIVVIQSGLAGAKVDALTIDANGRLTEIIRTGNASVGKVVQIVRVQSGALATGTLTIPYDDTIPQITEGNEFMTLAITPTATTNILKIDVVGNGGIGNDGSHWMVALFVGTTANALAADAAHNDISSMMNVKFTHFVLAGVTSELTFRVRIGGNEAGTTTFNGGAGARRFGGVSSSSITITEYTP